MVQQHADCTEKLSENYEQKQVKMGQEPFLILRLWLIKIFETLIALK